MKTSTEKLSNVHSQTLQRLNQLIKEINKYCDEHHRKQKQIKNEETSTIDAIQELKDTVVALNKAKEFYHSKTVEIEKLRRENASQKDIEKAEGRVNKACTEYKNLIEKYRKVKEDFENKFCLSCQNFQKIEEEHVKQMKNYLTRYSEILESSHVLMGQVYQEFRNDCTDMSTTKLFEAFISSKGTGTNRPASIQFEEANSDNSSICSIQQPSSNQSTITSNSNLANFLTVNNQSVKSSTSTSYSSALDILNLDLSTPSPQQNTINQNMNTNVSTGNLDSSNQFPHLGFSSGNSISEFDPSKLDNISHLSSSSIPSRKDGNKSGSGGGVSEDTKSVSTIDSLEKVSNKTPISSNSNNSNKLPVTNNQTNSNQKDHHKSFPDIAINRTPKCKSCFSLHIFSFKIKKFAFLLFNSMHCASYLKH